MTDNRGQRTIPASDKTPLTSKGRRTRANLIWAAQEIFAESGFRNASVASIAKKAGLAYGSFYNYFNSKEEIFQAVVDQVTAEVFKASSIRSSPGDTPVDRIERANRQYLRAMQKNARLMAAIQQVAPYDADLSALLSRVRKLFVERNERGIRRLQEEGIADAQLDPSIAASALGAMVEKYAEVSFIMGEAYEEDRAVSALTRLWAQAIGLRM